MAEINLDAARAARAEQTESHTLRLEGEVFTLPLEMPIDFAFLANDEKLREAFSLLFGEEAERFWALRPSVSDITELATQIAGLYGFDSAGESLASVHTSTNIGVPPRLTSNASTESTSPKRLSGVPQV